MAAGEEAPWDRFEMNADVGDVVHKLVALGPEGAAGLTGGVNDGLRFLKTRLPGNRN